MKELTDALKAVRKHALTAERVVQARERADEVVSGKFWSPSDYIGTAKSELDNARTLLNQATRLLNKMS